MSPIFVNGSFCETNNCVVGSQLSLPLPEFKINVIEPTKNDGQSSFENQDNVKEYKLRGNEVDFIDMGVVSLMRTEEINKPLILGLIIALVTAIACAVFSVRTVLSSPLLNAFKVVNHLNTCHFALVSIVALTSISGLGLLLLGFGLLMQKYQTANFLFKRQNLILIA